jgi:hypothetical protein
MESYQELPELSARPSVEVVGLPTGSLPHWERPGVVMDRISSFYEQTSGYRSMAVATMCLAAVAMACGADEGAVEEQATPASDVGGLTREQIEASAEPMSPEVAESLGIVDTTIHVQAPAPPESLPLGPPPTDSTAPRP